MFDKTQALYVKTAVIQNGVMDFQGDTLNAIEIKQIFTSFNNQNSFEIYHDGIPIEGVTLLENYISTTDEQIGNTIVPAGSWVIVMKVTCPTIQAKVLDKTFNGVSLSNRVKTECSCGLEGTIRYQDLPSAECVIPVFISLVADGANGVELVVFDYNTYIQKSKGSMKMNIIEELKALIQRAETDPVIQKSSTVEVEEVPEEPAEEGEVANQSEEEVTEEEGSEEESEEPEGETEEEPVINKECGESEEEPEEDKDEPVINKGEEEVPEDDNEKVIADLEAKVKELEAQLAEAKEQKDTKKPVITKSAKVVITNEETIVPDYYAMTGRDPLTGKKL